LKRNKTFIKGSRTKLENKKIRTEVKISKVKKIYLHFLGEVREKTRVTDDKSIC
jgi:hypothetical protein